MQFTGANCPSQPCNLVYFMQCLGKSQLISRHPKRLFLSWNYDLDLEISGQFIWTNLVSKGLHEYI